MTIDSMANLVRVLSQHQLLAPAQLNEMSAARAVPPQSLAQTLLQRGWLTPFQVKLVFAGRAADLNLGQYVLLERLGEGGNGQVFKARHVSINRVVALKVLRPELVADKETVGRFYREIEVGGQLPEHPNLIRCYDAGPVGATHFLAIEYIAGTDLEKLVKESGPLPVEQACDYIRQAALGLQHAHEHGLVHRDIKPSNLLVSNGQDAAPGTVKILDLGLARLRADSKGARETTLLTTDGTVTLGTVDYQAPEQALDFHRADIRADIYALGCSLFFLLTGKPPFGGGPLAVKLMRHQQAEPPDIKERRPEVPDGLVPILARMMAKKPSDRYQTPGEVAAALSALAGAPPVRRLPTLRRPSRKVLAIAGGVGGAFLLLLALGALLLTGLSTTTTARPTVAKAPPPTKPAPGSVEAMVPEAAEYQLALDLNLAKLARDIVYDVDRRDKITQPFDRIAYFIELQRKDGGEPQYLYVSMTAFTTDLKKIGVPTISTGANFQMNVASMNVYSNVSGIVTGTKIATGNIEFWPNNYGPHNHANVPNADSGKFDFGDKFGDPQDGYGSMQVHNYGAKQTLFAVNHWGHKPDIGIGNSPTGHPDWTFTGSSDQYRAKRLRVLVRCK